MSIEKSGYWLTKIRLHHWHAYTDEEIEIPLGKHGLHLTGDTGVGKTTIIDAILWTFIGDKSKADFNRAATQDGKRSKRSLLGYVRGEVPNGYLREQGTAHTILEFTHYQTKKHLTIGCLIDYDENTDDDRCYFITEQPLTLELIANEAFYNTGRFRQEAKRKNKLAGYIVIETFTQARDYRDKLCQYFGNLPPRFFDVISKLSGQQNLSIEGILFDENPIQINSLREKINNLRQAEKNVEKTQIRLNQLNQIQSYSKHLQTLQEQQLLYRIYNLKFAYEKLDDYLKTTQYRINQIEVEVKEKEEALKVTEAEQQQTQVVYENWISRQSTDKRHTELEHLWKLHDEQESLLKQVSIKLNQSCQAEVNFREWVRVLPVIITALAENTNLTIPTSVDCLTSMINVSEMNVSEIQAQLRNLYDWAIEVKAQLERQLSDLRSNIEKVKADLTKISQGKFPNERAYDVREILTRHGTIQVLCDLIEEVDTNWQPIIEKLMGGRRFTLITNENNYQDCLSTFRSLSARETDGVHLARPKDAEQSQKIQTGSLAEKVKAENWIAQGLLNRHLNGLQAYDDDDKAVIAYQSVATRTGLIVRGGTIQRLRPLDDKELVFDRESRERKREQLVAELEQFDSQAAMLTEKLKGLDSSQNISLQQKINHQLTAINSIDFSLPEQKKKFQDKLIFLSVEIRAIEESDNFVALQENVEKARRDNVQSIKKCSKLNDEIKELTEGKAQLTENQKSNQVEFETTQRQLAQFDNIRWQSGYEQVKSGLVIENSDITNALEEKQKEFKREVESIETQFEKAIRGYINEYSPILSTHPLEQQRQACLQEHDRLQSLELQKFQNEQKRYRSEAENILKTTFFDALLKEHKTIRNGIRDLNKAIQHVKLGSRNYRFNAEYVNTSEVKAVCEMLDAYESLKPEQQVFDLTHQIFETHRALIDRLFKLFEDSEDNLTRSAYETRRTLLTPTKYFRFDLQARQDNADWFSLNRYYDVGSGGEHQNPLYILLAGTMLQLYANNPERPRLVIIDEAFGKSPFSAGPGLKMLLDEGLQPIVSTVLNQPQVEEVIGYTSHISRPNISNGKYKKLVYVITDQKESF